MTYIYKAEHHTCKPPCVRLFMGTETSIPDANAESIWECSCGQYYVVKGTYWRRVGFWDFAAKARIKEAAAKAEAKAVRRKLGLT